jgi:hypothetical protein
VFSKIYEISSCELYDCNYFIQYGVRCFRGGCGHLYYDFGNVVGGHQLLGEIYTISIFGIETISIVKMEALYSSKTVVLMCNSIWCMSSYNLIDGY